MDTLLLLLIWISIDILSIDNFFLRKRLARVEGDYRILEQAIISVVVDSVQKHNPNKPVMRH